MSLKKNVVANYFGAGWNALMAMAFVPLYIRYLGMEAYGLIGIFAILQGWLWLLDMGMIPALSREMARFSGDTTKAQLIRNLLRSIEVIAICVAIVAVITIWLASNWLATGWLRIEKLPLSVVAKALTIMGWVVALRFIENIYSSSISGLQRQVVLNIVSSVMATLRGLGAVGVLVFISPTIMAFFFWQGLISLLTIILFAGVVYGILPVSKKRATFSLKAIKSVWRFAAGTMGLAFLSLLLTQVDKILLSRLLTLKAFGYYMFAVAVARTPFIVVGPVVQAFYPRFTQLLQEDNKISLTFYYHTSAQLITVLLGSASVMLIFFGNDILTLWTRDTVLTEQTYVLIAILSFGNLLNGMITIPYNLQLASGWTGLMIRINMIVICVVIPVLFKVIPAYGAIGAAWVWVFINMAYIVISIQIMHKRLLPDEKRRWYFEDVAIPLVVATATALFLRLVIPNPTGIVFEVVRLGFCFFIISLSAILVAPMVRRYVLMYLPTWIKCCVD